MSSLTSSPVKSFISHLALYICGFHIFLLCQLILYPLTKSPLPLFPLNTPVSGNHNTPLLVLMGSRFSTHCCSADCLSVTDFFTQNNIHQVNLYCCRYQHSTYFMAWLMHRSVHIPHFLYSFIHLWTLTLVPYPGHCEYGYNEHGSANILLIHYFSFLWLIPCHGIKE